MSYPTVAEWLDEVENYGTRYERMAEQIREGTTTVVMPWVETAWRLGGEVERGKRAELEMLLRDVHDSLLISAELLRKHGYNETADMVQAAFDKVSALTAAPVQ